LPKRNTVTLTIVAAGTTVLVSPYLLHRDEGAWSQPQEYLPQRWLPHLSGGKPGAYMGLFSGLGPNKAYLPFGAGPRLPPPPWLFLLPPAS